MKFDQILEDLPDLSESQLKEIQQRIGFLLSSKSNQQKKQVFDEEYDSEISVFYESISKVFYPIKSRPAYYVVRRQPKTMKLLQQAYTNVYGCSRRHFGDLKMQERIVFYSRLAQMAKISTWEDASFQRFLGVLQEPDNLLEKSFPGYCKSNLLDWIIFRKKK